MVVEDEAMLALVTCKGLMQAGYEVCKPVATGEQAIQNAALEKPDLILMDIRLASAMNGIEATIKIREFLSVPIIFLTGYFNGGLKERVAEIPATAYLHKPTEIHQLLAVIQMLLSEAV